MTDKMTEEQKTLVSKNVRLMYSFIRNKTSSGVIPHYLQDEFISDIGINFCKSAMKFDEERGFKFSTYAYGSFKYGCINVLSNKEIKYRKNNFTSPEIVESIIDNNCENKKVVKNESLFNIISKANLNEREMFILKGYYLENKTLKSVGSDMGLTKERIRQILQVVLKKIRKKAKSENLSLTDFMDVER